MTTPLVALSPSALAAAKKKRVLLVDASHAKRDLRAEVMRKLGIDVDRAIDIDTEFAHHLSPQVALRVRGVDQEDSFLFRCRERGRR